MRVVTENPEGRSASLNECVSFPNSSMEGREKYEIWQFNMG